MNAHPSSFHAGITFDNVTLGYDRHPAVHHLSGEVRPGALLALVGPNGAGKSTLLKGITGLLSPLEGRIDLRGCRRRAIGYLPQQAELDRSFPLTVFDFAAMGLWQKRGPFAAFRRADDEAVARALMRLGLAGFERRMLDTLSGGQMQRVLFARLFLQDAPLLLLDEPFANLDSRTIADLLALLRAWHAEGRTIIAVLHDLNEALAHFDEALLLARRVIAWGRTADVLSDDNLRAAQAMAEAFDDHAPFCTVGHGA